MKQYLVNAYAILFRTLVPSWVGVGAQIPKWMSLLLYNSLANATNPSDKRSNSETELFETGIC